MSINLYVSILIGVLVMSFIVWVLERELRLNIEETHTKEFINKWVVKLIRHAKKEILVASGEPCTRVLNYNRSVVESTLSNNAEIELKMIAGSKKMISDFALDLMKALSNPDIIDKTKIHEMDKNLQPSQHFILVDKKHMLLSYVDKNGQSFKAISLKRDRKKVEFFRNQFFEMWEKFPPIELREFI